MTEPSQLRKPYIGSDSARKRWVPSLFSLIFFLLALSRYGMPAFATKPMSLSCTPGGTIPCPGQPLQITKTLISPSGGIAVIGEILTFRITIKNVGHATVTRVWAADDYPLNCMAYVSSTPPGTDEGEGHITWYDLTVPLGDIPAGGSIEVTIRFRAAAVCSAAANWFVVGGEYGDGTGIPASSDSEIVSIQQARPTATRTATPITGMCCQDSYPDYAPAGMPDFDQRQTGWTHVPSGKWSYCGPVAAADALWWLDSRFETNTTPPPTRIDNYPLVGPPNASWDDHDPRNVPFLVANLAWAMDTNGQRTSAETKGTNVEALRQGIVKYIVERGLGDNYAVTTPPRRSPSLEWVRAAVNRCDPVILLLGFWEYQTEGWRRLGGHYVAVPCAGCDVRSYLAFSDPYRDRAERDWPGWVYPHPPHGHPGSPPDAIHNEASYISWDLYEAVVTTGPGGEWGPRYYATRYEEIADRLFISTKTVKTHVHHLYEKTDSRNRMELANRLRA